MARRRRGAYRQNYSTEGAKNNTNSQPGSNTFHESSIPQSQVGDSKSDANGQAEFGRQTSRQTSGQRNFSRSIPFHRKPSTGRKNQHTAAIAHDGSNEFVDNEGKKRKAESEPQNSRGLRRKRVQSDNNSFDEPFMDTAYIRRTLPQPEPNQYPQAPSALFGDQIVLTLHNVLQSVKSKLELNYVRHHQNGPFRCTLVFSSTNGDKEVAEGDGYSKRDAAKAAHWHMLSKLHQSGFLKEIFGEDLVRIDEQMMQEEADAKIDVYNYAARHDTVPDFQIRNIENSLRARKGRVPIEVSIEMKEHGIKVSAKGLELKSTEIAACLRFKEAAENYYAEHGDSSIVIRDMSALNSKNMKDFFDYYKIKYPRSSVETITKPFSASFKISGGGLFESQVVIDGENVGERVIMTNKKAAEEVSNLTAAVALTLHDSKLKEGFQQAITASSSGILMPLKPIHAYVDDDILEVMEDTVERATRKGLPEQVDAILSDEELEEKALSRARARRVLNRNEVAGRSRYLKTKLETLRDDPAMVEILKKRQELPMSQYRDRVLQQIENHLYSVIVGSTGSGKTTQVPQILLEEAISNDRGGACNIICTQPRRIAATSVARRVAEERQEKLQQTVGYQVRFDSKLPTPGGSITYCTTGVLLQQLQHDPDHVLDSVSHIIVDEVHERDILIDFLMIMLKTCIGARKFEGKSIPRVVLMSATIDSELFAGYFQETTDNGKTVPCPTLSVPGRTFPVQEKYLDTILHDIESSHGRKALTSLDVLKSSTPLYLEVERAFRPTNSQPVNTVSEDVDAEATIDWKRERAVTVDGQDVNEKEDALVPVELVALTIAHLAQTTKEGAILVFLPGFEEIKQVRELLEMRLPLGVDFNNEKNFKLYVLHSTVSAADQASVFEQAPDSCRKVILSTNIAETSVTIPDVQYVVDTGKLREKRYDQVRRITKLQCTWISKSNAKQRAGRAGRVRNGYYYALYSKPRFESLRAVGLPEILRSDLQEVCLDIKSQAFKAPIREFLAQAIEPPSPAAVEVSIENLISLQALTADEKLTAIGRLLAALPVHPSLGKMIVLGVIFRCLDPMIILGASMNERSLFMAPLEVRDTARKAHEQFLEGSSSDHIAMLNAFIKLRLTRDFRGHQAANELAYQKFLHYGAFRTIDGSSREIESVLVESGLIPATRPEDRVDSRCGNVSLNKNSDNVTLIKALTFGGLHPNLAVCLGNTWRTPGEKNTMIHPASLNYFRKSAARKTEAAKPGDLYIYSTMAKSNDGKQLLLRETSPTTPITAILFGGRLKALDNLIEMDRWLPFQMNGRRWASRTVMEFRKAYNRLLAIAFTDLAKLRRTQNTSSRWGRWSREEDDVDDLDDDKRKYLADEESRAAYAEGLIEVLDMEADYLQRLNFRGDYYEPPPRGDRRR